MRGMTWAVMAGILGLGAVAATAELKIPKAVFPAAEIEAAETRARADGKLMTFLLTDKDSTCPLCQNASAETIDAFDRSTVMVYIGAREAGGAKLPEAVTKALRSPEAGRYIPKSVIYDPDTDTVVHVLPYGRGPEMAANIRAAKKAVSASKRETRTTAARKPLGLPLRPATLAARDDRPARTWTSVSGDAIEAAIVETEGPYCLLKATDGTPIKILASRLVAADREYIETLIAEEAAAAP